jgi:hypothetical protein
MEGIAGGPDLGGQLLRCDAGAAMMQGFALSDDPL